MDPRAERERAVVRELALRVREIAESAENRAVVRRWRDVNALRTPDRSPVWCRPVGAWKEMLPEEAILCRDPLARSMERAFRQILVKRDIGDDSPVEASYAVAALFRAEPGNLWGFDTPTRSPGDEGGAWAFDPPLKEDADFDRLVVPRFAVDRPATVRAADRAADLLGDAMPVRTVCAPPVSGTLGTEAALLRGMSEMMLDMAVRPELMHRLMSVLRDGALRGIACAEESGLLTPNNTGPMYCSDPVGPPPGPGGITCGNLWTNVNSQEFDQVSPAMWEEFCLAYQRPIVDRFGLSAYGCCENLTRKMDGVLAIPNLRIFVCSAWTDLDAVIGRVGRSRVIMWRQKAADVVFADDVAAVRRGLEEGLRKLRGCFVQIVLRELQTLAGRPRRLHEWTAAAIELAARFS